MNENYPQPALPEDSEEGILRGMHRVRVPKKGKPALRLLGSGTILREVLEGADDPGLRRLREVWRPRALRLLGREAELTPEDVLGLRLEGRLAGLQAEIDRARAAGDDDAAQMAHARYIELGTSYARRFAAR